MRRYSSVSVSAQSLPCLLSTSASRPEEDSQLGSPLSRRQKPLVESPSLSSVYSSASAAFSGTCIRTPDEAKFFIYYVRNLSRWVDICDKNSHFATEVPRRALQIPLLAYSLIAVASRQLSLVSSIGNVDPAIYYSDAVGMLIQKLSGPVEELDENVLAVLILLRTYEEFTGRLGSMSIRDAMTYEQQHSNDHDDIGTHLSGVTQLLNNVSNFMGKGGLGEAASWIVLRQDMYYSLTKSHPLRIHLDEYTKSAAFIDDSPESFANRIIFLCARIQAYAFEPIHKATVSMWDQFKDDVEHWFRSKPYVFRPMWIEQVGETGAFPRAWMHHPAYVIGYQQYYLSLLLLAIFDPRLWDPGFDSFHKRRETDELVLQNLRLIVGLSISNPSVMPSRFLASHTLQACGTYLRDPKEQQEALKFLEDFEKQCGWGSKPWTDKMIASWSNTQ